MDLEKKTAIVTGAGSGIGRATAVRLAKGGARVVVSDVNEEGGKQTVEEITEAGGEAFFFRADTSKPEENEALVREAEARYGALHVAVNNAGIAGPMEPLVDYPLEDWDRVIAINLSGVYYGMRAQIPAMKRAGGGSIINLSSILGQVAFHGHTAYVAAKHGVVGLTRIAALEYSADGVRINAIGPAFIRTPMVDALPEDIQRGLIEKHPIGRLGEAKEVAELIAFLASDRASFITGTYYAIDGGYLAQ